jgi:hypothetical protein
VILVITGANGSLSCSFQMYLDDIPGKYGVSGTISTSNKILYFLNKYRYTHGNFAERCKTFPSFDVPQQISICMPLVA